MGRVPSNESWDTGALSASAQGEQSVIGICTLSTAGHSEFQKPDDRTKLLWALQAAPGA